MSSSDAGTGKIKRSTFRRALAGIVLGGIAPILLSACSFSPVYGDAAQKQLNLSYAEPDNRLEQVIYQDLALKLGRSTALTADQVKITAGTSSRRVGRTSAGSPATTYEAIVTATVTINRLDATSDAVSILYTATRNAAASYTTNGQRLADQQAQIDASERAAHQVADMLRLLIVGNL